MTNRITDKDYADQLAVTLRWLEDGLVSYLDPEGKGAREHPRSWDYIPLMPSHFIGLMTTVKTVIEGSAQLKDVLGLRNPKIPGRFLDVGTGIGTKARMAPLVLRSLTGTRYWDGHGIEINKNFEAFGRSLLGGDRFILGDALKYQGYGAFHVIYCYGLFQDDSLQRELEKRIYDNAREGTVLVQILKKNRVRAREPLLHSLTEEVFIKTSNEGLVGEIRKTILEKDGYLSEYKWK